MKVIKILAIVLVVVSSWELSAQVHANEEDQVRRLMDKFERLGKSQPTITGWRIKIINTTDRREMERARYKFSQLFPEYKSKTTYENPYYSIRTGAYAERIDLEPFLVELKKHFQNAIPTRDEIPKEEIAAFMANDF